MQSTATPMLQPHMRGFAWGWTHVKPRCWHAGHQKIL